MVAFKIKEPVEFFAESDYYLVEGRKYWRVTRVKGILNQPSLNTWRAFKGEKEARRIMKKRGEFGRKMHKLFELVLLGNEINPDNYKNEELKTDLGLFDDLIIDCGIKADAVEQHLWSDEYRIAGTPDYIGSYISNKKYLKKKDEPKFEKSSSVIGDWKSSSGIYDDYWIQLATYVMMFQEMTDIQLDGAFIAQFRDGKIRIEEKTYEELIRYYTMMLHCLELYKLRKEK